MRLAPAAALVVLLAVAAGCSKSSGTGSLGGAPTTTPAVTSSAPVPAPTTAAATTSAPPVEALPASWKLCQNPIRGTSQGYPGDWFTTTNTPANVCSLFHPNSFTIAPNAEYPRVAMSATQHDIPLATYISGLTDPASATTQLKENTTVAGRTAVKFEITSKGMGLDEVGTKHYGYAVDRGGKTFVLSTIGVPSESRYTSWKSTIDIAKGTVRFL